MLLLILVSKGYCVNNTHTFTLLRWGITFPTLSHIQSQKVLLAIILAVLFICYAVLFLWGIFWVDPAVVLYVYQSIPGVILLCVRFLTMVSYLTGSCTHSSGIFHLVSSKNRKRRQRLNQEVILRGVWNWLFVVVPEFTLHCSDVSGFVWVVQS